MKKNVYLFQPQYTSKFNNKVTYWIPYSVGCLWSYVQQFEHITENFKLKKLFFKRDDPSDVLSHMENPTICGFSCYVWNEKYCLELAKQIKQRWPKCVIVFGGEQVTKDFINYSFIDSVVKYEGEQSFLEILECIIENKDIPITFPKRRLNDLSIPSPYISGIFDLMIKEYPDAKWNMTLETNRGCPFSCTFCNWGSLTQSKIKKFTIERVKQEMEWCIGKPIVYIFVADANFGIYKERDLEIAKIISKIASRCEIDAVNLQYTKNSNEAVFEIAKEMGQLSRGVTVSMQSMNKDTLEAIKRTNMGIHDIKKIMDLSQKYQIGTYSELILGMPLETLDTWKDGICELLSSGQHNSIDVWFAQLLENSELADNETREKYDIEYIVAEDYMSIQNYNYWEDITETIKLVNKTSTMNTAEMIEAYMYAWLIVHFHITGYSQIYAKYLYYFKDITYRKFYDTLFEEISTNKNNFLFEHYTKIKKVVDQYLNTGKLNADQHKGHNLLTKSSKYIYDHKSQIDSIVKDVFIQLNENKQNLPLQELQKNLLFDLNSQYPIEIDLPVDIFNYKNNSTKVLIKAQLSDNKNYDFYALRRQNLIRNRIELI